MKKSVIILVATMILSSCSVSSLYYWGGESNGTTLYETLAYKDYKTQTPDALCKLICAYENIVTHPAGTRMIPPPGICAEYGYLLLLPETAATFEKNATRAQKRVFKGSDILTIFNKRGKEMLIKEIVLYPESTKFIQPLIKKLAD